LTKLAFERRYLVSGIVLSLSAADRRVCENFDRLLESVGAGPDAEPFYSIEVRPGTPAEADAELVFEGEVPEDGYCCMRRTGEDTHLLFPGAQSLTLRREERRAEIVVAAGPVAWTIWMMALEAALDAGGQTLLHAAALGLPGTQKAVLLYAPSGTGKTTTALALAKAGFALLADDAVAIGRDSSGFTAWGLPRPVKVHRHTAALLPFLGPALSSRWDEFGEQAVDLAGLARLLPFEPAAERKVAAVVQLSRATGRAGGISAASRADIFAALAADNVRIGRTGLLPMHRRKLDLLGKLAAGVPALRLEAGNDLSQLGPAILAALSGSPGR
jgi:hypothetical protein